MGLYSFFLVREMRDICSVLAAWGCSPSLFLELESGVVCLSSRQAEARTCLLPTAVGQGLVATYPQQLSWVKGLLPHNSCPRPGSGAVLPSWLPWATLGSEAVLPSSCFGPGFASLTLATLVWRRGLQGEGSGLSCRGHRACLGPYANQDQGNVW